MSICLRLLKVISLFCLIGVMAVSCSKQKKGSSNNDDPSSENPSSEEPQTPPTPPDEEGDIDELCGGTFLYKAPSTEEDVDTDTEEESEEDSDEDEDENVDQDTSISSYITKCHDEGRLYFVSKGCNSGCSLVSESWCSEDNLAEKFSETKVQVIRDYLSDGYKIDTCFKSADGLRTGISLLKVDGNDYKQQFIYKIKKSN